MCKTPNKSDGFSLVELIVVVGIIGILAAIAVPKLQMFTAKAKRAEAVNTLRQVHALQSTLFAEKSTYTQLWSELGVSQASLDGKYYGAPSLLSFVSEYLAVINLKTGVSLCPGVSQDIWFVGNCLNPTFENCSEYAGTTGKTQEQLFSGKPVPARDTLRCR
jgi:prepilin-type N-terminal cleavage/methylation domain-containing protein